MSEDRSVTITPKAVALTIAGSDPSGGAGLQADLKAMQQVGVYGMSVVTLLTVQNSLGVQRIEVLDREFIRSQFEAVTKDIPPLVIKTGALGDAKTIELVADLLKDFQGPIVVDPVLVSKHGDMLADQKALDVYRERLIPLATILTPNRYEFERIMDAKFTDLESMVRAAENWKTKNPPYLLIKAGVFDGLRQHLYGDPKGIVSIGVADHPTKHTHGAGCSLSAVIAARLALGQDGTDMDSAMRAAVDYAIAAVNHAVAYAPELGKGYGPVESRMLHIGT
jgi:hydroxymethylpyrimidine/phosphomethylpyrimidine kinase